MHICVSKLSIIGSDNGLSPGRREPIIWTNAGILLIGPLGTNFNKILIEIHKFSFKKIHFKMSSGKWWPSCLGLNVLMETAPERLSTSILHFSCDDVNPLIIRWNPRFPTTGYWNDHINDILKFDIHLSCSWDINQISVIRQLNPLCAKFFRGNKKHTFIYHVILPRWHDTGGWNPSSSRTRTYLSYIVNIMGADVLVPQGARASATMILT